MLLDIGFDAITVKAITQKADISRKTFYLHYSDKFDLLNAIVDKQLEELTAVCEKKREMGYTEGTVLWFRYFQQRKAFFAALFTTESTVLFRHRMLGFIVDQLNSRLEDASPRKDTEVLLNFMSRGVLGVLEAYVLGQLHAEVEEIAEQVGKLLEQIINGQGPDEQTNMVSMQKDE